MSPLEIVLTSVLGGLVLLIITSMIVYKIVTRALKEKVVNFKIFDAHAPQNPIVFFGDSLTDFYPLHEFLHDFRIVNRGIANETTTDMLARIEDIKELKPRTIFLLAGINDFLHKKAKTPKVVASRVTNIVKELQTVCLDVRIISLYPINKHVNITSKYTLRGATNQKIIETNELLKSYCVENGVPYLDLHSILVDGSGNLKKEYTIEGLHLRVAGYAAITPIIANLLKEIE